jgi:tetratricopeptide (TPR) repeat protein
MCGVIAAGLLIAGCTAKPDTTVVNTFETAEYGRARETLLGNLTEDRSDRNYVLDRMRLGLLATADGLPDSAERAFEPVYSMLREQGVNEDRTVASVVINEDLKIWKGEPFEQALALAYIGMNYAEQGDWQNLRAGTENSLFRLRDFGGEDSDGSLSNRELVERAAEAEHEGGEEDYLQNNYTAVESNFALGYLLNGIANQRMDRSEEARSKYEKAVQYNRALKSVVEKLRAGEFNTLLVVDYGRGPQKIGTGPDKAISTFKPITSSDERPLRVSLGGETLQYPIACDVNRMAQDHRWNNLEDMRVAKSHVGTLLVGGGAAALHAGAQHRRQGAMIAGAAMMAAGAVAKAGAHADTRYCEAMPQRIYVAPIRYEEGDGPVRVQVGNSQGSRLVLSGLSPPKEGDVQMRYVRLPSRQSPADWAVRDTLHYSNEYARTDRGPNLPYILGGRCVRRPTHEVLESYQRDGFLEGMSLSELRDLYRAEGIDITPDDGEQPVGAHVLEGGKSLHTPLPGTTGYARLFRREHRPYRPSSERVQEVAQRIRAKLQEEEGKSEGPDEVAAVEP